MSQIEQNTTYTHKESTTIPVIKKPKAAEPKVEPEVGPKEREPVTPTPLPATGPAVPRPRESTTIPVPGRKASDYTITPAPMPNLTPEEVTGKTPAPMPIFTPETTTGVTPAEMPGFDTMTPPPGLTGTPRDDHAGHNHGSNLGTFQNYGTVTTRFGGDTPRTDDHKAVDIASGYGSIIRPFYPGVVTEVVTGKVRGDADYGNYVKVKDKYGNEHYYSHLSDSWVQVGQQVDTSTDLGAEGNSGSTFTASGRTDEHAGSHLHYEIRDAFNKRLNPETFNLNDGQGGPGYGSSMSALPQDGQGGLGDFVTKAAGKLGDKLAEGALNAFNVIDNLSAAKSRGNVEGYSPKNKALENRVPPKRFNPDVTSGLGDVAWHRGEGVPNNASYQPWGKRIDVPTSNVYKTPERFIKEDEKEKRLQDGTHEAHTTNFRDSLDGRQTADEIKRKQALYGKELEDVEAHEGAHAVWDKMSMQDRKGFIAMVDQARKGGQDFTGTKLEKILGQDRGVAYFGDNKMNKFNRLAEATVGRTLGAGPASGRISDEEYAMIAEAYFDDPSANPFKPFYTDLYRNVESVKPRQGPYVPAAPNYGPKKPTSK